jgi:uncharacterized protein YecE (DUF72 family)
VTIYIGTSGWQYRHWRERFYPKETPQREWLEYYAARFDTVEVNNTFYRLPEREVFEAWRERAPAGFFFALKMSQYLTHMKRLRDPEEPVERFMEAARGLGPKLGPVLLQLRPKMKADPERLRAALAAFPKDVRLAVEFRDDSWHTDAVRAVLTESGAALCLADRGEKLVTPDWKTAPWGYVRLHWGRDRPQSCYTDDALRRWSRRIVETWRPPEDVFVYFNNDGNGCALRDASTLALHLHAMGREVSATPDWEPTDATLPSP